MGSHLSSRPDNASAIFGTLLTAHATPYEKGSWVQVGSALPYDCYGLWAAFSKALLVETTRRTGCDVGIDATGGTSFTPILTNVIMGNQLEFDYVSELVNWFFPIFIPSGATLGFRLSSSLASEPSYAFWIAIGAPTHPELCAVGTHVETVGAVSEVTGTVVTPGTTSEGAWTSLGTTTTECFYWVVRAQLAPGDISVVTRVYYIELGYGDGTSIITILEEEYYTGGAGDNLMQAITPGHCRVPVGSTIYARIQSSGSLDTNVEVMAYGVAA